MGTLTLVATPIGNLEDVTQRALRVLGSADLVLAEDTRRTRVLLERYGLSARPVSLHEHNEASRIGKVLAALDEGLEVALVSDAGTPVISDPGERLVAAAIEAGHRVSVAPGPSAVSSALAVSGLPPIPFTFVGFPPRRAGERDSLLEELAPRRDTLVFFESARRLCATLRHLEKAFGPRRACVARELTKLHEEVARGLLSELAEYFEEGVKGEVTLVVAGAPSAPPVDSAKELDAEIRTGLGRGEPSKALSVRLAKESGLARREVYRRILVVRAQRAPGN